MVLFEAILWDPNKGTDIGEWSICGEGWLERFYCTYTYVSKYVSIWAYCYAYMNIMICKCATVVAWLLLLPTIIDNNNKQKNNHEVYIQ